MMASSLTPFLDNQIPIPAPTKKDTKLVNKTVRKTSLEKMLFFLSLQGGELSFELLKALSLLEEEDFLLLTLVKVHSRLQGMFGFDDQSHIMSEAVNPPWTSSGLTK